MERAKLILAGLAKLTPAKSFLLGTAFVLVMPESLYSSIALTYHEIAHDNTYSIEENLQSQRPQTTAKPPQPRAGSPEDQPK